MRLPRGWKRLTREQPKTLFAIVRYSKRHGDLVPTPAELIEELKSIEPTAEEITEPAARERIARLRPYFAQREGSLFVNVDRLCTKRESALFLLIAQSMSAKDSGGRVFKSKLFKKLLHEYRSDFPNTGLLDELWSIAIETGYLIQASRVSGDTDEYVRPGRLITYQHEYLEMIAGRKTA